MPDLFQAAEQTQTPERVQPAHARADTGPGASDGLSPSVVQALSAARQGGLQQLFGAEWEAAGTRLDAAYRSEGPGAYERLTRSPESFGAVTGDPQHAAAVAGGLYAREQVLAEARGETPQETSRSPETRPDGASLTQTPQPSAWVGTDGKAVSMSRGEDGRIELGPNASPELRRYAGYVSDSTSRVAREGFEELSFGPTRVQLRIGPLSERTNPYLIGLHQAHDAEGPISWDDASGDQTRGVFERRPDYVTDAHGAQAYREATITMYEDAFTPAAVQAISEDYGNGTPLRREDALLAVFLHEAFHDTDDRTVAAIETRSRGGTDTYAVEDQADGPIRRYLAEIQGPRR